MLPATLLAALTWLAPVAGPPADPALQRAHAILARVPLIDGHNDLPWAVREYKDGPRDVAAYDLRTPRSGHTDLPRMRIGQLGGQFWSVYVPGDRPADSLVRLQLEQIDLARQIIARYPADMTLVLGADELERAFHAGKIASLLGAEGGHTIVDSLAVLRTYYTLGVRYLTLTHNVHTHWADCAALPPLHGGLTPFGEEVVREMNRIGMLVDLSHVAPETMDDALRVSVAPVIFSHSSARALTHVSRNVPDDILVRLAKNGGIVMVTFLPAFVSQQVADYRKPPRKPPQQARASPPPRATLAQVADHIEHIRKVAGVDHVGIGGDFDGMNSAPLGLEDVSKYPDLFAELIRRGWTDPELEKLAGKNLLRVLRAAEAVARDQAKRPASLATMEQLDQLDAPR